MGVLMNTKVTGLLAAFAAAAFYSSAFATTIDFSGLANPPGP
jgi:hypothetical protein